MYAAERRLPVTYSEKRPVGHSASALASRKREFAAATRTQRRLPLRWAMLLLLLLLMPFRSARCVASTTTASNGGPCLGEQCNGRDATYQPERPFRPPGTAHRTAPPGSYTTARVGSEKPDVDDNAPGAVVARNLRSGFCFLIPSFRRDRCPMPSDFRAPGAERITAAFTTLWRRRACTCTCPKKACEKRRRPPSRT